jgi:hypothetical protein
VVVVALLANVISIVIGIGIRGRVPSRRAR